MGLKVVRHTSNNKINSDTDIYLVDTYGEASSFYKMSNITFLGGSLIAHGGQNPLEPARLGNYILHGPNVHNFKEIYKILEKFKISSKIDTLAKIEKIILKKVDQKQSDLVRQKIASEGQKILKKNLSEINKYI